MIRSMLVFVTLAAATLPAAFGDCGSIATVPRPRIYFPSPAYGPYATLRERWKAAENANTVEFRNLTQQAAASLTANPGSPYFYDAIAFEMAFLYALDPARFATYGPRALYFLDKAIDQLAPSTPITAATNSNPVIFTAHNHGLTSGGTYTVWGGSGSWAAVNIGRVVVTVRDADTFSIAVDSTGLGPLTGSLTVSANSLTSLNQGRWDTPVIAATWDWAHDQISSTLSPYQQAKIMNALASSASLIVTHWYVDPNPTGGTGNLTVGPMNGALQAAIALAGDVPGMEAVCEATRKKFLEVVPPAYTTGGIISGLQIFPTAHGGAYVESTEYAPQVVYYLMQYMLVLRGATGENLYPTLGGWYGDQMRYLMAATSPSVASSGGTWPELFPYGDILIKNQHHTVGGVVRQNVEQLAYYFALTGDQSNLGYAEWWLRNMSNGYAVNDTVTPSLIVPNEFLWYDPTLIPLDYRTDQPLDYYADGLGVVLSRSSWDKDATWLGFKGGALRGVDADHFHGDVLGFALYRKGDWLTNELQGWGGNTWLTKFHNVPLPDNGMPDIHAGSNPVLASGQKISAATAKVVRYEATADDSYLFAEADATPIYRGSTNIYSKPIYTATVNTAIRDLLYLKPDTVVIADRLAYDAGHPTTAKWLLQALADPGTPAGNTFTLGSLLGTQELNVSVVCPASPLYNVVSPDAQLEDAAGGAAARQWRIEISSGKSTQAEQYLMVLQAGDAGFTPVPVATLAATNLNAAQFGQTVVAAITDTRMNGVTRSYTFDEKAVVRHIIMGLQPGVNYSVTRPARGQVVIADATGGSDDQATTPGGLLVFTTLLSRRAPVRR